MQIVQEISPWNRPRAARTMRPPATRTGQAGFVESDYP